MARSKAMLLEAVCIVIFFFLPSTCCLTSLLELLSSAPTVFSILSSFRNNCRGSTSTEVSQLLHFCSSSGEARLHEQLNHSDSLPWLGHCFVQAPTNPTRTPRLLAAPPIRNPRTTARAYPPLVQTTKPNSSDNSFEFVSPTRNNDQKRE